MYIQNSIRSAQTIVGRRQKVPAHRRPHRRLQSVPVGRRVFLHPKGHGEHEHRHQVARRTQGTRRPLLHQHSATALRSRVGRLPGSAAALVVRHAGTGRPHGRLEHRDRRDREQAVRRVGQVFGVSEHGGSGGAATRHRGAALRGRQQGGQYIS